MLMQMSQLLQIWLSLVLSLRLSLIEFLFPRRPLDSFTPQSLLCMWQFFADDIKRVTTPLYDPAATVEPFAQVQFLVSQTIGTQTP